MVDNETKYSRPSRSQMKRDKLQVQNLVERALDLARNRRQRIEASDLFHAELELAAEMKSSGARKRLVRRLATLAQGEEGTLDAIVRELELEDQSSAESRRLHQESELWRGKLVKGDGDELTRFCDLYPGADVQRLRQLARDCAGARSDIKRTTSYRELYREIQKNLAVKGE